MEESTLSTSLEHLYTHDSRTMTISFFQKNLVLAIASTSFGLTVGSSFSATAATFTVSNTFDKGDGSLRQAIIDANTTSGNDVIEFLLDSGSQTIDISEELSITDNLFINGLDANLLTISDQLSNNIFSIGNGANVEISGLTLTRGRNGLVISSNSTVTVTNSIIRSNFQDGIVNDGQVTLVNTTVGPNGDFGIINSGTMTLTNSSVTGHDFSIANSGTVTLTNSTVSNNNYGIANSGTVTLTNSTVNDNFRFGLLTSGTATVTNSTFSRNGAGIINEGTEATTTVTNSTFSRNGAGIANEGTEGTINIGNTIIAQNSIDLLGRIDTINDLGYNLIGNGEGSVFINGINGNIVGSAANPVNPLLGFLANNGGSTQTQALLPGSLAIDAANPSNFPTTDQRGVSRPQGARADIGAFEVVQTSPPPKSVPEPSALGGLAILGLLGLLRKKVCFSH